MIKVNSDKELREAFRPLDRDEVEISFEFEYPLKVKDYLSWTEPSGKRIYLVFADRAKQLPYGIVFHRDQSGSPVPMMCEWCHAVRSGDGVTLLTAAASSNRRVGIYLCSDLSCKEKANSAPEPDDIPQILSAEARVKKILDRMGAFVRQNLF